jgi:hypothetical protein
MGRARMAVLVLLGLAAAAGARADEEAQIKALLDKVMEAHGGRDKVARHQAAKFSMQGKVQHSGETVEFKGSWAIQAPDRLRIDVEVPFMGISFKYTQVLDSDKSWNALNENALELSKAARAEACEQGWAYNVARLSAIDQDVKLRWLGETKIAGRAALGLSVQRRHRREVKLFFDRQNGLLLKSETKSRDLLDLEQEFTVETFYSDYRKVNDIPAAHKITMQRDGKPYMEMECKEYTLADSLGDAVFARP